MRQAQDANPAAGGALARERALAGVGGGRRALRQARLARGGGAPGGAAVRAPAAARLAVLAVRSGHAERGCGVVCCRL